MLHPDALVYKAYETMLKHELIPAIGCTELIAVAYAGARARSYLGEMPNRVLLSCSPNVIKNARSLVIPNTGSLKGLKAAVAAGIVAGGDGSMNLELLDHVTEKDVEAIRDFLGHCPVVVSSSKSAEVFEVMVELSSRDHNVTLRMLREHTNIVYIERDGEVLYDGIDIKDQAQMDDGEPGLYLNVADIVDFSEKFRLSDLQDTLDRQYTVNRAICEEGLAKGYGAQIGRTIMKSDCQNLIARAKSFTAAGSDARMSGCPMPAIIISGSGNQGLTASMPVAVYAEAMKVSKEKLLRALCLSDLLTLYMKNGIGRLSAYCGVVSAATGAAAAICWLHGGGLEGISQTIINGLVIVSGMICDGAKPSCAAKISCALEASLMGWQMYENGRQFHCGEGLVSENAEKTIANISRLGRVGMVDTDAEIISMMEEMECYTSP